MNKIWKLIAIGMVAVSSLAAKEQKILPEVKVIVPLTDLAIDTTKELFDGSHSDVAILCEAGTELPLKFLTSCEMFSIKWIPNLTIKVDKTCYFRAVGKKVYMSYDLINWNRNFPTGNATMKGGISPDKSHVLIETRIDLEEVVEYNDDYDDEWAP